MKTILIYCLLESFYGDRTFRLRLHEQIKPPLIAQILHPYEVTPDEFAQIKHFLFAHVNAALLLISLRKKAILRADYVRLSLASISFYCYANEASHNPP